uniref:Bifunctional inhibitor/plant lipid transfer protein/seed storage helical domain-containing protein n=1 Tax=Oryza glumipatula TaxID=40148 RepID=A0A0E0AGD3_9ORYZ
MARNNGVAVMFAAVVVVAGALVAGAAAQSGCTSEMVSLAPCLDYMQGNASRPTASCCAALSSVVKSRPECLSRCSDSVSGAGGRGGAECAAGCRDRVEDDADHRRELRRRERRQGGVRCDGDRVGCVCNVVCLIN